MNNSYIKDGSHDLAPETNSKKMNIEKDATYRNLDLSNLFLSNIRQNLLLILVNIVIELFTILLGSIAFYYNTQLTNSGYIEVITNITIFSFIVSILLLFYLTRKIANINSQKIDFLNYIFYDGFLFGLLIIFGYLTSIYRSKIYPVQIISIYDRSSLFSNLGVVSFFAFIVLTLYIILNIFILKNKTINSTSNLKIDYTHNLFTRNIVDSHDPSDKSSTDEESVIFINKGQNNATALNCPKCGSQINIYDKFCQKCGTKFQQNHSIL